MVDLCAPGSNVESTVPGNSYGFKSGTSMASPHAAGVAALVWSTYPELSHETLIDILLATAKGLPEGANNGRNDEYGHGLVDAEAAYAAVLASFVPTESPAPSSSSAPSNTPSVSLAPSSTPTEFCTEGIIANIQVLTDGWPFETSWDVRDASNNIVASRNSFSSGDTLYEDEVCLTETETCEGTDYVFTIKDSWGDGICCGQGQGSYEVKIDGEVLAEGGDFDGSESTSMCHENAG